MARHSSTTTTNHDEIRRWAEARGAKPARVKGTGSGDDPGMIRLDFPGYSGAGSLEEISWNDWFRDFDRNELALVYQDHTARGAQSNFNKLVSRNASTGPTRRTGGSHHASGRSSTHRRKSASATRAKRGATSKRGRTTPAKRATSSRSSRASSSSRSSPSSRSSHKSRSSAKSRSSSPRSRSSQKSRSSSRKSHAASARR